MSSPRAPRRSGLHPLVFLLVGALIAALVVGADRLTHRYAERQVAARLRTELGMAADPRVTIEGFPFLTQVAMNRFRSVHVSGTGARLQDGGQTLALRRLDVRLTDVTTAEGYAKVTAGGLEGTTALDWAEASRLFRAPLSKGEGDRVLIDASQTVYGQRVRIHISGRPTIDPAKQTFTLSDPRAELAGFKVPDSIVRTVMKDVVQPTVITLPLGLRATSATAAEDGLEVALTGRNVPLTR